MLAKANLFEFKDYKSYLRALVGPASRRLGVKSRMAQVLRCQPTYISQVINSNAHFSLEQAEALSVYLGHSLKEKKFFLLLLQKDRAGTASLKAFLETQIQTELEKQFDLTQRLGAHNELSEEEKGVYYSSWHYAAFHIALTIPELRTPEALSKHFGVKLKKVIEVLGFLEKTGLIFKNGENFEVGKTSVRLAKDSPHIARHHSNWRERAIDSLDREEFSDLHYSGVVSLSLKDVLDIKNRLLEAIKENLNIVKESKEELLYCLNLDFFNLKR